MLFNLRYDLFADFLERERRFDADDLDARLVVDGAFLLLRFLVGLFFFAPFPVAFFLVAAFFAGAAFLSLELDPSPTNSAIRETIPFFFVVIFRAGRPC